MSIQIRITATRFKDYPILAISININRFDFIWFNWIQSSQMSGKKNSPVWLEISYISSHSFARSRESSERIPINFSLSCSWIPIWEWKFIFPPSYCQNRLTIKFIESNPDFRLHQKLETFLLTQPQLQPQLQTLRPNVTEQAKIAGKLDSF